MTDLIRRLIRKIIKFSISSKPNSPYYDVAQTLAPAAPTASDGPFAWANDTFTVEVTRATNGHVLSVRRYNYRKDEQHHVLRVCGDEGKLHEEIAALLVEFQLKVR